MMGEMRRKREITRDQNRIWQRGWSREERRDGNERGEGKIGIGDWVV